MVINYNYFMNFMNFKLLILIILSGVFAACSRPSNVLSASDMANVLTDLHKVDGIAAVMRQQGFMRGDSVQQKFYAKMLAKHKLTQSQFDSSLVWYSKNPKKMERVYLQVEENLKKWQKDIAQGKYGKDPDSIRTVTLFEKSKRVLIKDTADYKNVRFEMTYSLMPYDIYTLSFYQKFDSTKTPHKPLVKLKIQYEKNVTDSFTVVSHTDGITRRFKIVMPARRLQRIVAVKADLLVPDSVNIKYSAQYDSIRLTRTYNILQQDSLQKKILKMPDLQRPDNPFLHRKSF